MKNFKQLIIGLSSLAFAFTAISYDNTTGIVNRWQTNRPAVEAKITQNQTSFGNLSVTGKASNIVEVQKLVNQVLCVKGDASKCRAHWAGL